MFGLAQRLSLMWKFVLLPIHYGRPQRRMFGKIHKHIKYSNISLNRQSYAPMRSIILNTSKHMTLFRIIMFKTRKSTWNGSRSIKRKLLHCRLRRRVSAGVSPSARRGKESEGNTASDWPNWNGLIEVMHSRKYWFCCRCRCSVYLTGTSTLFSLHTCSSPPPKNRYFFLDLKLSNTYESYLLDIESRN